MENKENKFRIEFPYISIEEDDEPKHSTQEIFKAIADNDPGSLEALIQEGFSVNLRDLHDVTPLHAACARGLAHIVTVLLNNGAGLNAVTGWCSGHLDIVQLLLRKYKADWKMTDDWGWNILHEAAVNGDKDLISCIMKWINPSHNVTNMYQECRQLGNQADKLGRTPLILGLLSGAGTEAVEVMLELGEDPRKEDQVGRGCAEAAILYCREEVVSLVVQAALKRGGVDSVSKKLMMEIAKDRADSRSVVKLLAELIR